MISKKIETAINNQINAEFYSAFLYLSMAAYCDSKSFKGMANWLNVQYQEELTHALKLYNFILDRGGAVELRAIKKPPATFKSILSVFEGAYEHEKLVTGLINDLYALAKQEKDFASEEMLHWFISEQVEEEANTSEIADNLKHVGNDGNGLLALDQKLGARVFVDETAQPEGE